MTAAEYAKLVGLDSLKEASQLVDTSFQTLNNWKNDCPKRFKAVILGAAEIKRQSIKVIDNNA